MKFLTYSAFIALLAFGAGFGVVEAQVESDPSSDADQDGPSSVVSNTSSDTDQDGSAGFSSDPSSDTDQDNPTNTDNGNGNGNGGGGSDDNDSGGGTSSGSSRRTAATVQSTTPAAPTNLTVESCPLITTFMKLGANNNGAEVAKLQVFLKNVEGLSVEVTGTFDAQTELAVKAFQRKYLQTVMGPWSATRPSGIVYITTSKKINELACKQPLTLTASELAIIEAYKARIASGEITPESPNIEIGTVQIPGTLSTNETVTENSDQTAAASEASVLSRFWRFIKNLFR